MGCRTIRTDRTREIFLAVLAKSCNVSEACRAANVGRTAIYAWRDEDASFSAAWAEAEEAAADSLLAVAWERASTGQSDRMLEILLKGHLPRYRDKQALDVNMAVTVDYAAEARQEVEELFGPTPHLIEAHSG